MPVEWIAEEDCEGANEKWLEKFKSGDFSGKSKEDIELFFKAMIDFGKKAEDDDDLEYNELIEDAVMQYETLAIFLEVRDSDLKYVQFFTEDEQKIGHYTDNWKDVAEELGAKSFVQMEMIDEAMKQIMSGNPNTDSFFFAGTLTVDGPIKLAVLPREWIVTYYEENGIEVD
ncbi:hypothetical protein GF325_17230 [Candidatus Bathyarchaeota archaeon]|nr:hypothetical protein [Candidatus Bathyarchaeota archaeon]